jgi:hypothetical protein
VHLVQYYWKPTPQTIWTWRLLDRQVLLILLIGRAATPIRKCAPEVRQMWLQQDGAPDHFGGAALLSWQFPDPWIDQEGPDALPSRSPDLTLMDYFLWGHMKSLAYANRSNSRAGLIKRTADATVQIRNDQEMVMKTIMSTVKKTKMHR